MSIESVSRILWTGYKGEYMTHLALTLALIFIVYSIGYVVGYFTGRNSVVKEVREMTEELKNKGAKDD